MITTLDDFKTEKTSPKTIWQQIDEEIKQSEQYLEPIGPQPAKPEYQDVKETAQKLRKQYKKYYPNIKVSVRISRYSMGQSIDVTIKEIPREYLKSWEEIKDTIICSYYLNEDNLDEYTEMYLDEYKKMYDNNKCSTLFVKDQHREFLEQIHQIYNYKESDYYTDYYYSYYHGGVDFEGAIIL